MEDTRDSETADASTVKRTEHPRIQNVHYLHTVSEKPDTCDRAYVQYVFKKWTNINNYIKIIKKDIHRLTNVRPVINTRRVQNTLDVGWRKTRKFANLVAPNILFCEQS